MSKTKSIGSMVTMVASRVAALASPPATRLPTLTWWRPIRPVMGARTSVNPRSSRARASAASSWTTCARAASSACTRCSTFSSDAARYCRRFLARSYSCCAKVSWDRALVRRASASVAAAANGRGSMRNSRSPRRTTCPPRKWIEVEVAADPGAEFDALGAGEAAGELVPVGDLTADRGHDRHPRRRHRRGLVLVAVAAGGRQPQAQPGGDRDAGDGRAGATSARHSGPETSW